MFSWIFVPISICSFYQFGFPRSFFLFFFFLNVKLNTDSKFDFLFVNSYWIWLFQCANMTAYNTRHISWRKYIISITNNYFIIFCFLYFLDLFCSCILFLFHPVYFALFCFHLYTYTYFLYRVKIPLTWHIVSEILGWAFCIFEVYFCILAILSPKKQAACFCSQFSSALYWEEPFVAFLPSSVVQRITLTNSIWLVSGGNTAPCVFPLAC